MEIFFSSSLFLLAKGIGIILPITCIIIGLLGAATYLIAKIPSLKDFIEKISPYQAGIGATGLVIGVFKLVDFFGSSVKMGFITSLFFLISCIACIILGLVLGFPTLQKLFINDMSEEHRNKAERLRDTLAPYQILSGVLALGLGLYLLILS